LHEAFVIASTTIRPHLRRLVGEQAARAGHLDIAKLKPVLDALGAGDAPLAEIPALLLLSVESQRAHAGEPVPPSNDEPEIDGVIRVARVKLAKLDSAGAIATLQAERARQAEERISRARGEARLAMEEGDIHRIAYQYDAAITSYEDAARLDPDSFSSICRLGDAYQIIGNLADALHAFEDAASCAKRNGEERDLSVSHERIGNVRWRWAISLAHLKAMWRASQSIAVLPSVIPPIPDGSAISP
jgi:tetratricopeptide (TPR) repeat protein